MLGMHLEGKTLFPIYAHTLTNPAGEAEADSQADKGGTAGLPAGRAQQ